MSFILNQFALAFWNFINSRIDAYRILKNKTIAHGINFGAYAAFAALVVWISDMNLPNIVLFGVSAFFNRQLSFDIPLNLRRKLDWYYQSTARHPKAILDRIENAIFGMGVGKEIVLFYGFMWVSTILIKIIFL